MKNSIKLIIKVVVESINKSFGLFRGLLSEDAHVLRAKGKIVLMICC